MTVLTHLLAALAGAVALLITLAVIGRRSGVVAQNSRVRVREDTVAVLTKGAPDR